MKFWDHQASARSQTRRLLLAFALAVLLLVVGVHAALVLAWWLMAALLPVHLGFPAGFLVTNIGVSLLLVLGGWWLETSNLRAGGVKLAQRIGAREARPALTHAEQRLCNIVEELCIAANMARPQVMVLPRTDAINAFAAGWDDADAVVAVTEGALQWLTRDELQGMVAHELSHLHEGDTRLNMRLVGMVFGLELVYHFGEEMRERRGLAWWFGSAIMLAGLTGWLTGRLLKAAVSRQREFLADARAVQWTRSRDGLGGVLRKVMAQRLSGAPNHHSTGHAGLSHPALQHLLLVDVPQHSVLGRRLDSHPPLQARVQRIYGRAMQPLPLTPVPNTPEPAYKRTAAQPTAVPGAPTLASQADPFARYL
jgi:Zn-dependent protease with chaperone function